MTGRNGEELTTQVARRVGRVLGDVARADPTRDVAAAREALEAAGLQLAERGAAAPTAAGSGDMERLIAQRVEALADLRAAVAALERVHEEEGRTRALDEQRRREAEAARRRAEEEEKRRAPVVTLVPGVTMQFVLVPAGSFEMGSRKNANEQPIHTVHLDEYYIGRHPVTVAQFAAFVNATAHRCDGNAVKDARRAAHPVAWVSWDDAAAFCRWASEATGSSIRLPTEAEWEKAARGTDGREYPWGNEAPDDSRCRFGKLLGGSTPVGSFSPRGDSPYGAADMAGNVWEWCADWYGEDYYRLSPGENPRGPLSGTHRVVRGGSWLPPAEMVRAPNRHGTLPDHRFRNDGFRCARSV